MKFTKFDVVLNVWISLILNFLLNLFVPLCTGAGLTFASFISCFAIAYVISFLLALFVPIMQIADKFANLFKLKLGTIPHLLVGNVAAAIIMASIMNAVMVVWSIKDVPGFTSILIPAILAGWPYAIFFAWIGQCIGIWTGVPLAKKILGETPIDGH